MPEYLDVFLKERFTNSFIFPELKLSQNENLSTNEEVCVRWARELAYDL